MHKHKQRRGHALCPILGAQWAAVKLIVKKNVQTNLDKDGKEISIQQERRKVS